MAAVVVEPDPRSTNNLPRSAGTYAIVMRAQDRQQLQIGRLGGVQLSKGWYSISVAPLVQVAWPRGRATPAMSQDPTLAHRPPDLGHNGAGSLVQPAATEPRTLLGAGPPGPARSPEPFAGFGASDCQCLSHLVRFPTREAVKTLFNALEAKVWIPQL
ncbi:MAG: hypothetical protein CM1200mP18_07070 [Gammaproteobacteria bacterium]|nr:MAG: hypothetical protein CM1200mP18_07070 [Gammaproteobacteria bacterium]